MLNVDATKFYHFFRYYTFTHAVRNYHTPDFNIKNKVKKKTNNSNINQGKISTRNVNSYPLPPRKIILHFVLKKLLKSVNTCCGVYKFLECFSFTNFSEAIFIIFNFFLHIFLKNPNTFHVMYCVLHVVETGQRGRLARNPPQLVICRGGAGRPVIWTLVQNIYSRLCGSVTTF